VDIAAAPAAGRHQLSSGFANMSLICLLTLV